MAIKRIVIIFIIAIYLLNFTGISYSNEEPKKHGELWDGLSDIQKATFVVAMDSGITKGFELCMIGYADYFSKRVYEERYQAGITYLTAVNNYLDLRSPLDLEVISKVITELYKDPANIYISISDMYILALRKIKGEDIEPLLREARKEALYKGED